MVEFKQLNLKKDQEVVVETAKGKFFAIFNKLSQNGARLDVVNVKDENSKPYGAFKYFFKRDVISIKTIDEGYETPPSSPTHGGPQAQALQLTPPQLAIISNALTNFTYIQQADSNYFQALEDISKQFVIGISADCCRGR